MRIFQRFYEKLQTHSHNCLAFVGDILAHVRRVHWMQCDFNLFPQLQHFDGES